MPLEPPIFAFILTDGKVENVAHCRDYYEVLAFIHRIVNAASSNTPLPKSLLQDGKIVIENDLHVLGWKYGVRMIEASDALHKQIKLEFPLPVS